MIRLMSLALVTISLAVPLAWVLLLPQSKAPMSAMADRAADQTIINGLQWHGGRPPLIAVAALNDASETTDLILPIGLLRRANIADVRLVAAENAPIQLYPALRVMPDMSITAFDQAFPEGADYIIIPAMSRQDQALAQWLRQQAARGARIIAICVGALVAAEAGLLDGRKATTHWYYRSELQRRATNIQLVRDRRMVMDQEIVTTTGISASMPMMLMLIEAIGGHAKAQQLAQELAIDSWNSTHDSEAFQLTQPFVRTILANRLQFWRHEQIALNLDDGMDEVTLALAADSWSRTYRSRVVSVGAGPVTTANGLVILPDRQSSQGARMIGVQLGTADAIDRNLQAIAALYGQATSHVVAMQLEYASIIPIPAKQLEGVQ